MIHIESNIKIYFTRNYSIFNRIKGNRVINKKKVAKIVADIQSGNNWLPACPIVLDPEMNVLDGQHRLEAAEITQENIFYLFRENTSLHTVAKVNTNTERWKAKDFINCYKEQGVEDYDVLDAFLRKNNFPFTLTVSLLQTGKCAEGGLKNIDQFEKGEFKCLHLEKATQLSRAVHKLKAYDGFLKRNFIVAVSRIVDAKKCDFDELVAKFNKNHDPIKKANSAKDFAFALEQIYNLGNHKRKTIL